MVATQTMDYCRVPKDDSSRSCERSRSGRIYFANSQQHVRGQVSLSWCIDPADHGNRFSTILGLLYAPLVPFVAPFLTVGLVLQYCYHKLQAKVLFVTVAETGARFWLPEMDRILLFLLVSHAFLALTCALQMADGKIALML